MRKIRVLIVEDSRVVREYLEHIIGQDPRLEIAKAVESAEDALDVLDEVAPDVVSMDIRLPGMSGFEATQQIMRRRPTPIVVVAASVEAQGMNITMNALRAGALSVIEKPAGIDSEQYTAMAERLCTQLAIMSQVKVVRQHAPNGRRTVAIPEAPGPKAGEASSVRRGPFGLIGIVSSTGGPSALVKLLGELGPAFPAPIALVQHIPPSFLDGFAEWLADVCPFRVEVLSDSVVPVGGSVYMARGDRHLRFEGGRLRVDASDPVSGQRPSGSVLFQSIARSLGPAGAGVLLTGMGDDGAVGLLELRKRGGYTIAEDASTAVVYGMPREAMRLGAVTDSLPLHAIAPRILELLSCGREVSI